MRNHLSRLFLIIFGLLGYTVYKASQLGPQPILYSIAATVLVFAIMMSATFIYRSKSDVFDKSWYQILTWGGSFTMGLWATYIILSLPFDVLRLVAHTWISQDTFRNIN